MQRSKILVKNSHLISYDGLNWYKISFSNVVCIEKELRKMTVYYRKSTSENDSKLAEYGDFFLNEALSSLMDEFDDRFFVCKRGCLINFEFVRAIEDNTIILENGHEIALSRRLILKMIREYEKYLGIK